MKKGFTLIELLVVVLIIGILSAVALPQYRRSVEKARAAQAMVYLDAFVKANMLYKLANGTYSSSPWAAAGIKEPILPSQQWGALVYVCIGCSASNGPFSNAVLKRKLSNAEEVYYLVVNMISRPGEEDFVMRFCTGNESMCKVINGGAGNCSENGSPTDPMWCYTTKSNFR